MLKEKRRRRKTRAVVLDYLVVTELLVLLTPAINGQFNSLTARSWFFLSPALCFKGPVNVSLCSFGPHEVFPGYYNVFVFLSVVAFVSS